MSVTVKNPGLSELDELCIQTIRFLSVDGVQKANSGHPGITMGMAPAAYVLWTKHLKHNPANPQWHNRDRFVLSAGHGSMLLYSLLHLCGYDIALEDLKNFRQWGSKTPGHPEYNPKLGVEVTTGPLGQGISNAVGMAIAQKYLASYFNRDGFDIMDYKIFCIAGDGDLEEGISHEVCSFAGHNKLGKLILFYDSNHITIDGNTSLTYSDDVKKRFESYHWQVLEINGQNYNEIHKAISKAKAENDKPTIIICNTTIGFGSPNKAGTSGIHGSPLGEEEIILTKENLGISTEKFYVPQEVYDFTQETIKKGIEAERIWNINFESYKDNNKDAAKELQNLIEGKIPDFKISEFEAGTKLATRASSGKVIEELAEQLPMLIGGSADLTPSNKTKAKSQSEYSPNNRWGNYIHYGIREFGMAAVMNGISLHGGLIPYGGTFFVFSDYMRSAMRMAALMGIRVIYVLTHDSIGLGEDGPTHQPVEHLSSLRVIPNMTVFRPMDANETAAAWKLALNNTEGPSTLVLTRQGLTTVKRNGRDFADISNAEKGAYAVSDDVDFDVILMASGSEVEIALEAKERLNKDGIEVRVISFLSQELFDKQSDDYKKTILPSYADKRIAVEAGSSMSWYKYVGDKGKIIGIDNFGASAPYEVLYEKYGITAEAVYNAAKKLLK